MKYETGSGWHVQINQKAWRKKCVLRLTLKVEREGETETQRENQTERERERQRQRHRERQRERAREREMTVVCDIGPHSVSVSLSHHLTDKRVRISEAR